jgi:hypothetical protein
VHQEKSMITGLEEIHVDWLKFVVADSVTLDQLRANPNKSFQINIPKLLVALEIVPSRAQGERQAEVGVFIDGVRIIGRLFQLPCRPFSFQIKSGKSLKLVVIE